MRSKLLQTAKKTFYSSLPLAVIIILCLFLAPLSSAADYIKIYDDIHAAANDDQ